MVIKDKHQMYKLLNAGLLGQALPSADSMVEAYELSIRLEREFKYFDDLWAVRSKLSNSSCLFNLSLFNALKEMTRLGNDNFNFSPMLNDEQRVCYAHLNRDPLVGIPQTWNLHYTTDKKPARLLNSRDGCDQKWMHGLQTKAYLRMYMDDIGWTTLNELIEMYPDHCIEFSIMTNSKYAFGKSNTIFWEVRCLTGEYEASSFRIK